MEAAEKTRQTQSNEATDVQTSSDEDFLSNARIPIVLLLVCLGAAVLALFGWVMFMVILPLGLAVGLAVLLGTIRYDKSGACEAATVVAAGRDRTYAAGIISICCVTVVVVMAMLGSPLFLIALPLGLIAGVFGVYRGIRERRAMVLLPALGAVACVGFSVQAYHTCAVLYRRQFAPDLRAEADEVVLRLAEYVRTHDGQLPMPHYLADALGKDLNDSVQLAGIRGPQGHGWLAVNRNVLGRNISELPAGTVLIFESNPRIGLHGTPYDRYGWPEDITRNPLLGEEVLIVTLQASPYYQQHWPPRLYTEIEFVPSSQLGRYFWDPQRPGG